MCALIHMHIHIPIHLDKQTKMHKYIHQILIRYASIVEAAIVECLSS